MAITVANFKVRFPEFSSIADARVQLFIDDAIAELDEGKWEACKRYERGVNYLAAHWLFLGEESAQGDASGGGGGVSSESVGSVSRSFGSTNESELDPADTQFLRTKYGIEFLRLQRFIGLGAKVIGNTFCV